MRRRKVLLSSDIHDHMLTRSKPWVATERILSHARQSNRFARSILEVSTAALFIIIIDFHGSFGRGLFYQVPAVLLNANGLQPMTLLHSPLALYLNPQTLIWTKQGQLCHNQRTSVTCESSVSRTMSFCLVVDSDHVTRFWPSHFRFTERWSSWIKISEN